MDVFSTSFLSSQLLDALTRAVCGTEWPTQRGTTALHGHTADFNFNCLLITAMAYTVCRRRPVYEGWQDPRGAAASSCCWDSINIHEYAEAGAALWRQCDVSLLQLHAGVLR